MLDMIQQLGALVAILTLAFTAGYNWRRITALEVALADHLRWAEKERDAVNTKLDERFALRETVGLELSSINSKLDYLRKQVDQLIMKALDSSAG